jgi:hypothetical protein
MPTFVAAGHRSTDLPRPRDDDVAIREELEAARRAGTIDLRSFPRARPDHPLAEQARGERTELWSRPSR